MQPKEYALDPLLPFLPPDRLEALDQVLSNFQANISLSPAAAEQRVGGSHNHTSLLPTADFGLPPVSTTVSSPPQQGMLPVPPSTDAVEPSLLPPPRLQHPLHRHRLPALSPPAILAPPPPVLRHRRQSCSLNSCCPRDLHNRCTQDLPHCYQRPRSQAMAPSTF